MSNTLLTQLNKMTLNTSLTPKETKALKRIIKPGNLKALQAGIRFMNEKQGNTVPMPDAVREFYS